LITFKLFKYAPSAVPSRYSVPELEHTYSNRQDEAPDEFMIYLFHLL